MIPTAWMLTTIVTRDSAEEQVLERLDVEAGRGRPCGSNVAYRSSLRRAAPTTTSTIAAEDRRAATRSADARSRSSVPEQEA